MKTDVNLRVSLTESQVDLLQRRLNNAGMKVNYQEEQHGAALVVAIGCTHSQERTLREILEEIGVSTKTSDE
jgi:hypothetical protein